MEYFKIFIKALLATIFAIMFVYFGIQFVDFEIAPKELTFSIFRSSIFIGSIIGILLCLSKRFDL